MVHQAFGYSFVLTCLYFFPYPLFAGDEILFCFAAGLAAAGAAVQFFLLRKGKKALWLPLLCIGVLAVFEAQYQLIAFHVINAIVDLDFLSFVFLGVVTQYVLLGAVLGGLVHWAYQRNRLRKENG